MDSSSSSLFIVVAHLGPSSGGRKSSQGFASEITEVVIWWLVMNFSFSSMDEYETSMGLPLDSGGREGSSSEGRMMRRGGRFLSGRSSRYGTVLRKRRRDR